MASIESIAVRSAGIRAELSELTGVALGEPGQAAKNDLFAQAAFETWLLEVLTGIYGRLDALESGKPPHAEGDQGVSEGAQPIGS